MAFPPVFSLSPSCLFTKTLWTITLSPCAWSLQLTHFWCCFPLLLCPHCGRGLSLSLQGQCYLCKSSLHLPELQVSFTNPEQMGMWFWNLRYLFGIHGAAAGMVNWLWSCFSLKQRNPHIKQPCIFWLWIQGNQAAQGSGGGTIPGGLQEMCKCVTEGHGLVGTLW